jgi:hypothetical protein
MAKPTLHAASAYMRVNENHEDRKVFFLEKIAYHNKLINSEELF